MNCFFLCFDWLTTPLSCGNNRTKIRVFLTLCKFSAIIAAIPPKISRKKAVLP